MEEHREHLRKVLELLRENSLYINKKCNFEKGKLEYLGHLISVEGVEADPKKIDVMVT